MHDNGVHAHQLHQDHVSGKAFKQFGVGHGIATKFDDKGSTGEPLDVRQGLGKNAGEVTGVVAI